MQTHFSNHPLLQTVHIQKVIRDIDINKDDFMLESEVPVRDIEQTRIAVDIRKVPGGMTQAAISGAESPTVAFYGTSQYEFEPAEWREKVILTHKDMHGIRKLGTKEDVERASEIIARNVSDLLMRLENRMEWMRWQAMKGSLTHTAKDVSYNVDYKVPADCKPTLTGVDKWDQSTSDPMDDILEWLEKYQDNVAIPDKFLFNQKLLRVILQNTKIRTLRDTLFAGQANLGNLTPGNLKAIFNHYAGYEYEVYNGGYFEITDLSAAVAASGTVLTVRDVGDLRANDRLKLIHRDGDLVSSEILTVSSVDVANKQITVASPGVAYASGYPVGSSVRVKRNFIESSEFIIKGRLPSNVEGGPAWAEVISAAHPYGANFPESSTGIISKTVVEDDHDPPRVSIIIGRNALPVLYHRDVHIIATVK